MLTPQDIASISRELELALVEEGALSDRMELVFHYYTKVASGGDIARHYDNAPLNAWDEDTGLTTTEVTKTVTCMYIPKVEAVNLVQEGYHPDSDIEVLILSRDLRGANITIDDIRNTFEYVSMLYPHTVDIRGKTSESIERLWDIVSVRPITISNQLISLTLGLSLREQDTTKTSIGDK